MCLFASRFTILLVLYIIYQLICVLYVYYIYIQDILTLCQIYVYVIDFHLNLILMHVYAYPLAMLEAFEQYRNAHCLVWYIGFLHLCV